MIAGIMHGYRRRSQDQRFDYGRRWKSIPLERYRVFDQHCIHARTADLNVSLALVVARGLNRALVLTREDSRKHRLRHHAVLQKQRRDGKRDDERERGGYVAKPGHHAEDTTQCVEFRIRRLVIGSPLLNRGELRAPGRSEADAFPTTPLCRAAHELDIRAEVEFLLDSSPV
jgi:hypothetical protein